MERGKRKKTNRRLAYLGWDMRSNDRSKRPSYASRATVYPRVSHAGMLSPTSRLGGPRQEFGGKNEGGSRSLPARFVKDRDNKKIRRGAVGKGKKKLAEKGLKLTFENEVFERWRKLERATSC